VLDDADPARSRARLVLVGSARVVLASGLRLLGIRPLEYL